MEGANAWLRNGRRKRAASCYRRGPQHPTTSGSASWYWFLSLLPKALNCFPKWFFLELNLFAPVPSTPLLRSSQEEKCYSTDHHKQLGRKTIRGLGDWMLSETTMTQMAFLGCYTPKPKAVCLCSSIQVEYSLRQTTGWAVKQASCFQNLASSRACSLSTVESD